MNAKIKPFILGILITFVLCFAGCDSSNSSSSDQAERIEIQVKIIENQAKTIEDLESKAFELTKAIDSLKDRQEQEAITRQYDALMAKRRDALELAREEVARAKEAVAAEKEKVEDIKARYGALSDLERAELKHLVAKAKRGEQLNQAEENRLSQLAPDVTAGFIQGRRIKRFEAEGGAQVIEGLASLPGWKPITEEEKVQRIKARFGALSALDRAELKRIVAKAKSGGQLSQAEENRLAQLAPEVSAGFIRHLRIQRFKKEGAAVNLNP